MADSVRTLGRNIRRLRLRAELTQKQVTEKLKIRGLPLSRSEYAQIECSMANITPEQLKALREIFRAEYHEFFAGCPCFIEDNAME